MYLITQAYILLLAIYLSNAGYGIPPPSGGPYGQSDVRAPEYAPPYARSHPSSVYNADYGGTKTGHGGTKSGNGGTKTGRYSGTKTGHGTKSKYSETKTWYSNDGMPNYSEFHNNANMPFKPICEPTCKNTGICVDTNTCRCPANFYGTYCEFEKKPCLSYPPLPMNAERNCAAEMCTIKCMEGHKFIDGSNVANMRCMDGQWQPTRADFTTIPDCLPECSPACENGGVCLAVNTCQCPVDFRGPQCQYSVKACDIRKLEFNGAFDCFGDTESTSCSLSCPPGSAASSPLAEIYTCRYATGRFEPQPIPHCEFREVVVITPGSHRMNSTYSETTSESHEYSETITSSHTHHSMSHGTGRPVTIVVQDFTPKGGTCLTWAGVHYKTFDGKIYSFESPCQHILVRGSKEHEYSVAVKHGDCKDKTHCPSELTIILDDKSYVLSAGEDGSVVFRNSKRMIPMPASLPGIRVAEPRDHVLVNLDAVGVTIKWDTNNVILVEGSVVLWNNTEGLCGTLDGNPVNDFMTKDKTIAKTKSVFASSWQINKIGDLCDSKPTETSACASKSNEDMKKAQQFCTTIFSKEKFRKCSVYMDISLLLEACQWDFCACTTSLSPEECACSTVSVYAKECLRRGVEEMKDWRDADTCPMKCPEGKIYKSCGPDSQASCAFPIVSSKPDNGSCVEGCFCPEGLLLEGGRCVPQTECPCRLRNKSFKPGSTIRKDCNTCTCQSGEWVCTAVACGARCGAVGDPHYTTFDGLRYDFMGHCIYTMLQTGNLTVNVENIACSGAITEAMDLTPYKGEGKPSCTKSVTLTFEGAVVTMKQGGIIIANDNVVSTLPVMLGDVRIRAASSMFIIVQLPNKIDLWWDGNTRVFIDVPAEFKGKTKGLCGTFNLNQKDDFLTPENDIEQSALAFANKWKTREFCSDIDTKEPEHPCKANIENKEAAEKYCSKLKSKLFEACRWYVDVEPYYEECLYDMCACASDVTRCLCPVLGDYAMTCAKAGVLIQWRYDVLECELECTGGQEYTVCADSCLRRCTDMSLATSGTCRSCCVEGCACPFGQLLNDDNECVPTGLCPCYHKGIPFNAGYKEVRAGRRERELCTCVGARWDCKQATPSDIQNYPPAEDLRSNCSASKNMEFTTCEIAEPLTCKNMHLPPSSTTAECRPGCQCKRGFVLDTMSKKCVAPPQCPCHHGGRSYPDGHVMQEECNTCECKSGNWTCTNRKCAGVCAAWGDSHVVTFDGTDYDFEGVCTYLLAKGVMDTRDGFDVEIQNVPCGTTGATCSKSVTLKVGGGGNEEIVSLTKDAPVPDISKLNRIKMRIAGTYVFLDVPSLGMSLQWDRGMRVYVKVISSWQGRVKGLCGNYNGDMRDDFQTPSGGGMAESSALIFADSWKLMPTCPKPQRILDHCKQRPERKEWASSICSTMKQYPFTLCHAEVSPSAYMSRCTRDACACDAGADCECACTALAAYAYACAHRGVTFKWRTQQICPMQCDEECSNYDACLSPCPAETCDNTLYYNDVQTSCKEDSCVEGCKPKKSCPEGQVYKNSSHTECVPRAKCKPVCMVLDDGRELGEGDVIEEDDCHTCRCSKKQRICTGQPCTTPAAPEETTTPKFRSDEPLKCVTGWTDWINRGPPTLEAYGESIDKEPLPLPKELVIGTPMCKTSMMRKIECRTVGDHKTPKETGLDVECSLERGLYCKEVGRPCLDFEIRVYCECELGTHKSFFDENAEDFDWIPRSHNRYTKVGTHKKFFGAEEFDWIPRSRNRYIKVKEPSICENSVHPNEPHPTDCSKFYECAPSGPVLKQCGPGTLYNPVIMNCDWPANVALVRPECSATTTGAVTTAEASTLSTTTPVPSTSASIPSTSSAIPSTSTVIPSTKTAVPISSSPLPTTSQCPPGLVFSACAYRCDRLCDYFRRELMAKDRCIGETCVEGCLEDKCDADSYWRDEKTCVPKKDCTCFADGKMIKPGGVMTSGCTKCQCLNNELHCDSSDCVFVATPTQGLTHQPIIEPLHKVSTTTASSPTTIEVSELTSPPPECSPDNYINLLWGDEPLPASAFSASSIASELFEPQYAKLNGHPVDVTAGSWNPKSQDQKQYIQVELPQREPIFGVVLQGSPLFDQYVTSYEILYGDDKKNLETVIGDDGKPKIFEGPSNHNTPKKQMLQPPIEAKVLRIRPLTWNEEIAIRFEVIGCKEPVSEATTAPPKMPRVDEIPKTTPTEAASITTTPATVTTPATSTTPATVTTPATYTTPATVTTPATYTTPATVTTPATYTTPATVTTPATYTTPATVTTPATYTTPATVTTPATYTTPATVTTPATYTTPVTVTTPATPAITTTPATIPTSTKIAAPMIITSTVSPPPECNPSSYIDLMWGDQPLPASALSASSVASDNYKPEYAKLNGRPVDTSAGSWNPAIHDTNQYLQVTLPQREPVYGVVLQGSPLFDQYVTSYHVLYGDDGFSFSTVNGPDGKPKVFRGPVDHETPLKQMIEPPVEAKVFRVQPLTWHDEIAIRLELIGCKEPSHLETTRTTITPPTEDCTDPLGLGAELPLQSIEVSSNSDARRYFALDGDRGWRPLYSTPGEWIMFNFTSPRNITAVKTKGGPYGWVTTYKIMYTSDLSTFNPVVDATGADRVFPGNFDSDTTVVSEFKPPIHAQYFKVLPISWKDNIEMRVEPIGCFEPYPVTQALPEVTTSATTLGTVCEICPGVPSDGESCACTPPAKYFDGDNCVTRDQCPCLESFMTYPVGSTFRGANCDECVCKLGGVTDCKPVKECLCAPDLVPKLSPSTCECLCEPCPAGTKICPTSKLCLPLEKWCDGLQDCPDDEKDCTTSTTSTTPAPKTTFVEPTVVTTHAPATVAAVGTTVKPLECPKVECPPNYIVSYTKTRTSSSRYTQDGTSELPPPRGRNSYQKYHRSYSKGGYSRGGSAKGGYSKGGFSKGGFSKGGFSKGGSSAPSQVFSLDKPGVSDMSASGASGGAAAQHKCAQFTCVPPLPDLTKPLPPCTVPSCPPGYTLELDRFASVRNNPCPQYKCTEKLVYCNVTGRTFHTFDGTEYKYDTCFHVLARENKFNAWNVIVRKKCRVDGCVNELLIQQDDQLITVKPNLMIEYDNYEYTVEQTSKICFQKNSFSVARMGNGITVKSRKHNFEVLYTSQGDIKIGVSSSFMGGVDGLCGIFDGHPSNDRRLPDGSMAKNIDQFGRSWAKPGLPPNACQTKPIPPEEQKVAWVDCKVVLKEPLSQCGSVLNLHRWHQICMEKICECSELIVNGTRRTRQECRCLLLEQLVAECLAADKNMDLSDWRIMMDCPAECPPPLVHYDCYRKRCEPSCAAAGGVADDCPAEAGRCHPGCYCPEGKLRKGDTCVLPTDCRDCTCNGLGTPANYKTFEGDDLPFLGNCTYLASRDRNETGQHKYEVYSTNGPCDDNPVVVCTKAVHLIYEKNVIHISKDTSTNKLVTTFGDETVFKYPVKKDWVNIDLVNGLVSILLPDVHVELTVQQPKLEFTVSVPSYQYANRTEGLCGVCLGYQEYLVTSNGTITEDFEVYGKSWQASPTALTTLGVPEQAQCDMPPPPPECVLPPPETNPCYYLYNADRFGACHALVDPDSFLDACEADLCANATDSCVALERYAAECRRQGICLEHWREDLCPYPCEEPLVYRACVNCEVTCENSEELTKNPAKCDKLAVEGCFCPEGKVRVNNTCIETPKCFPCDAKKEHYAGDEWQVDACTKCTCSKLTGDNTAHVACTKQTCTAPVCSELEDRITKPAKPGQCCDEYMCVLKPKKNCTEAKKMECGFGQVLKQKTTPDGCQEFACECKPESECAPLPSADEVDIMEPGMERVVDNSGCCPRVQFLCQPKMCPSPPACPKFHDLITTNDTGKCCPETKCEPPKDKCVVTLEWEAASKGGEKARATPQTILKDVDSVWLDGPCRTCRCEPAARGTGGLAARGTGGLAARGTGGLAARGTGGLAARGTGGLAARGTGGLAARGTGGLAARGTGGLAARCAVTECPAVLSTDDFVLEPRPVPFQCCPQPVHVACRDGDNIYKIGESWSSPVNACESYKCVEAETSGKLDKVTTVQKCLTDCQPGWKYFPATPESGECCGKCEPVACIVDGKERPIGDKWVSSDFCANYTCVNLNGTLQVQCSNETCPEVSDAVKKQFVLKEEKVVGKCCPNEEPIACRVGNKIYQEGQTWSSPDPCKNVTCARDVTGRLTQQESLTTCSRDCKRGWHYQEPPAGVCCGHCEQTACVVEDDLITPGTMWHSDDNCTTYSCDKVGDEVFVTSSRQHCPDVSHCAPENLVNDTCCQTCKEPAEALSKCVPTSIPAAQSIGLVHVHLGPYGLCINKEPLKGFKECRGTCDSGTIYNNRTGVHDSRCECCQASRYLSLEVQLACADGSRRAHRVASPATCACAACGGPDRPLWPTKPGYAGVKSPPRKGGYAETEDIIPEIYQRFGSSPRPRL